MPELTICPRCESPVDEYGNCECPLTERGRFEPLSHAVVSAVDVLQAWRVIRRLQIAATFSGEPSKEAAYASAAAAMQTELLSRRAEFNEIDARLGLAAKEMN